MKLLLLLNMLKTLSQKNHIRLLNISKHFQQNLFDGHFNNLKNKKQTKITDYYDNYD